MSSDSFKCRPIVFGREPLLTGNGTIKSANKENGENL